jgi:hypothetical protein
MPFCPDCRTEYVQAVKTCPECKVDLVDALDDLESSEEYIELYMVSNRMEAEVILSFLAEHGIHPLIRDLRSFPVLPDFGRRARLRIAVPGDKEAEARKLLEEARQDGALTEQGKFL